MARPPKNPLALRAYLDIEEDRPIRRRRVAPRQPLDTRTAAQYARDAVAIQAAMKIEASKAETAPAPIGVHHGHTRGFLGGRLLDDRKRADERMNRRYGHVDYSAEREARARRASAEWKPEVLGRRLVGKPARDRRNRLVGKQARRVETWDRVCRLNLEIGVGRPGPSTAAGFARWLKDKNTARLEADKRELARLNGDPTAPIKAATARSTRKAEVDAIARLTVLVA